jgi:hypothetical protein
VGAFHDGNLIGSNCLVPGRFYINNQLHRLGLSGSTVTRKEYRTVLFPGPTGLESVFSRLCRLCYEEAEAQGFAGVFGFPNKASYRGFVNHLKFVDIGQMEIRIAPYRLGEMLAIAKGWPTWFCHALTSLPQAGVSIWHGTRRRITSASVEIHDGAAFDDRYHALNQQVAARFMVVHQRDAAFLKWRFSDHPRLHYSVLEAVRNGQLLAYLVFTQQQWPERSEKTIPVGFVVDYQAEPTDVGGAALQMLFVEVGRRLRRAGLAMATVIHSPHPIYQPALASAGFVRPPTRMQPRRFSCVLRGLTGLLNSPETQDLGSWMLTMADADIV